MQSWAITNKPKAGPYHNLDQVRLLSCTKVGHFENFRHRIKGQNVQKIHLVRDPQRAELGLGGKFRAQG